MSIIDVDCSGCSACYLICPVHAIEMAFNEKGTYSAHVNKLVCVECQSCTKVCSSIIEKAPRLSSDATFTSVAKDLSVLKRSSSGGVGHVFAKKGIDSGMSVCGVTYDPNMECAKHILIRKKSELYKIQGSKYLQSANADAFSKLVEGKEHSIVFGTPCQIAGLHMVLEQKKLRDHFILVDIFCHGTPSQLLWGNHLSYLREKGKIKECDNVSFRQKKDFRICIGEYTSCYNQDAFYTFFLRGWLKNHKCYYCQYRRNSFADIRIGDCMVEKYSKLDFSPSTIIINTARGTSFFNTCIDGLEFYHEPFSTVDTIQERENMAVPDHYEEMISKLQEGEYPEQLIRWVMIKGRVKAFAKQLLKPFYNNSTDYNLEELVRRNQ